MPGGPALAALWAAGAVADPAAAGEAELVVDVGAERTHVCVVSEGHCLFARTFASGAGPTCSAPRRGPRAGTRRGGSSRRDCPAWLSGTGRGSGAARRARFRSSGSSGPRCAPSRRVRRAVPWCGSSWPAGPPPGPAWPRPWGTSSPSRPSPFASPGRRRTPSGPEDAPRFALPLALALRGWLGTRFQRLNLRRGELASTRSTQDVRERLQRIAVYASLVLLLALVSSIVRVVALNRQEKLLDRSMCEVTQRVVGKCFDDFAMAESVLRGRGTVGASIPRVSAAGVLAELAARGPPVQLRFDRIEISREKLHLQGTTDAAENVDRIVSALRGSRCFADARSGGARKRGTEPKFEFTVDADITCEGAPAARGRRAGHGNPAQDPGLAGGLPRPPLPARAGDGVGGGRPRSAPSSSSWWSRGSPARSPPASGASRAKTEMLSQIGKLTRGYRQAQAERQSIEARLKGPPVQLMSFVSQTGAQSGVEVNDLRPGTPSTADGLTEESVEVNLARIDLPRLARLVDALERGPGVVKVRKIRIATRNDDPNLVDVTLQVSTWQQKT